MKYRAQMKAHQYFPGELRAMSISLKFEHDDTIIGLSALLTNILIGTIGFFFLFIYRHRLEKQNELKAHQWLMVFLSLWWLSMAAVFVTWIFPHILNVSFAWGNPLSYLAHYCFHIPAWLLVIPLGILGFAIPTIVVFKFIPPLQRLTFITSGFVGCISGYVLWFIILGPRILG